MVCTPGVPQLVIVAPGSDRVRRIKLHRTYMVVGREPDCDVRLDDPHVSRAHAAPQRRGNAVYVRDLGSVLAEGLITIIAATRPGLFGRSGGGAGRAQRPLGPDIAGLPAEMLGWAPAMVGFLLLTAGIGLHLAAAWRRRRARWHLDAGGDRCPDYLRVSI